VYSEITTKNPVGIGLNDVSEVIEKIKIDIRSRPSNASQSVMIDDTHARKVLNEVQRVLHSVVVNPSANYQILNNYVDITDLSDGMRGVFRYILRVELINYCQSY
jgi:hypothetical protein